MDHGASPKSRRLAPGLPCFLCISSVHSLAITQAHCAEPYFPGGRSLWTASIPPNVGMTLQLLTEAVDFLPIASEGQQSPCLKPHHYPEFLGRDPFGRPRSDPNQGESRVEPTRP